MAIKSRVAYGARWQSTKKDSKKADTDVKLPPVVSDYNPSYLVDSLPPKTFTVLSQFKWAKQGLVKH
jgi:hypothetical protein